MTPIVYGQSCVLVEPTHELQFSLVMSNQYVPDHYGINPTDVEDGRTTTTVAGHPAIAIDHTTTPIWPEYKLFISPGDDKSQKGVVRKFRSCQFDHDKHHGPLHLVCKSNNGPITHGQNPRNSRYGACDSGEATEHARGLARMELEGDYPAPRPPAAAEPIPPQNIHVTPDNVIELAAAFRQCTDKLEIEIGQIHQDLRLKEPWMDDPVSEWAWERFNSYFVDSGNPASFAGVLQAQHNQYRDMAAALVKTAHQYGLDDEVIAAGLNTVRPNG